MRIIWSEIAQVTFVRFMADQAGMMAVNRAVEALADDPAPPGAFVRGSYRRLRVGPYRVLYEVEENLITIVRVDRVWAADHRFEYRAEASGSALARPAGSRRIVQSAYREIAGSTRNPSHVTCSTRFRLPPWKRSDESP